MSRKQADLSYIHPQLRPLAVPINSLKPDPRNARQHPERNLSSIVASLRQFGQRKPIVVQRKGNIVRAGNGTLEAAKQLGWTHLAAVVVDEENALAAAYAIADNRTAELAEWDYEELGGLLASLRRSGRDSLTGWLPHEVEPLIAAYKPPAVEDDQPAESAEPESHWVEFTAKEWAIVGTAIEAIRKKRKEPELSDAQALALICDG